MELAAALEQLKDSRSPRRRSAAKALRKLQDPAAGPALLEALREELRDTRTWETQYHMILALGLCRHTAAAPFLRELAERDFEATTLYLGIGDALVRLAEPGEAAWKTLTGLLRSGDERRDGLAYGACRAMAMLRLVPPRAVIEQLIGFARRAPLDETRLPNHWHWVAAATPGWLDASPAVRPFLQDCLASKNSQVTLAAEAALAGKYIKWGPY